MRKAFKFWLIINGLLGPVYFIAAGGIVGNFYKELLGWIIALAPQTIAIPLCVYMIGGAVDAIENDEGWLQDWWDKEPKKQLEKAPEVMELGRWQRK